VDVMTAPRLFVVVERAMPATIPLIYSGGRVEVAPGTAPADLARMLSDLREHLDARQPGSTAARP
jgi:hypothetical protein